MALTIEGVTVKAGGRALLDRVEASFARGRVTAILGPNGAGKSTLAGVLAGLTRSDAGQAMLDGQPLLSLPPRERARRIGYLPQAAQVQWNLKVEELVALGRLPHHGPFAGMSDADHAAVDRALAATDTARFAGRGMQTLSGGEAARVHLARVLAGEPEWIIADEPLEGLDPAHRLDVLDVLRAAAGTRAGAGAGVIVILHDLSHAARAADDALLIDNGRIVAAGSAQDVLTAERLAAVYGVRFFAGHDARGAPLLVPMERL